MSILKNRVGERLRALNMSQSELARRAGVSPGFVTDLMTERKKSVRSAALRRLADVLQVEPSFLTVESRLGRIPRTARLAELPEDDASHAAGPPPPYTSPLSPPVALLVRFITDTAEQDWAVYLDGGAYIPVFAAQQDSETILIQQPQARVGRPPQLMDVPGSYAVRVPDDGLSPRYFKGELAYAQPGRSLVDARWVVAVRKSPRGGHLTLRCVDGHADHGIVLSSGVKAPPLLVPYADLIALHRIVLAGDDSSN